MVSFFSAIVRQVEANLLDEWERLKNRGLAAPLFARYAGPTVKKLPVLEKKPTLENARTRLGGRPDTLAAPPGMAAGAVVSCQGRAAAVVYASGDEVHVLFDPHRLKRARASELEGFVGEAPREIATLADDASVFAMLGEGQSIRYADDGGALQVARLVEKCRYGALVAREDGTIVAVGFRKLWPAKGADS